MESELKGLAHSEVPESSEGKGALVMKVKQTLIGQLKTLLFSNTSDIGGGEQVRTLFNKFHDAVFKVGEKIVPIKSFVNDYLRYIWDLSRTTKNYPRQNCWGTVIQRGVLRYPNKDSPLSLPLVNIGSPGAAYKPHNQQQETDKGESEGLPLSGVLDHFDSKE